MTQNTKNIHLLKLKLIPNKVTFRLMNESRGKKNPQILTTFLEKTRVASKGQNPSLACSESSQVTTSDLLFWEHCEHDTQLCMQTA